MKLESKVLIHDTEKVKILKSLMESSRSHNMFWHDRAYIAATASFGLLLTITKLWIDTLYKTLDTQRTIDILNKVIDAQQPTVDILNKTIVSLQETIDTPNMTLLCFSYVIAIGLTEWVTQIYFDAVKNAYDGNEKTKVRCEYALRLKEGNAYIGEKDSNSNDYNFFYAPDDHQEDKGMQAIDISVLRRVHNIIAGILAAGCIISLCINRLEILISLDGLRLFISFIVGCIIGITSTVLTYWKQYQITFWWR